jgi:SAM-dependent methyltransferase
MVNDVQKLTDYLRFEAGSSNPGIFQAVAEGGYKLQQIPEEFSKLLLYLKDRKIEHYLELGIGNGGSFEMICEYLPYLKSAYAVDDLSYGHLINQNQEEIEERIGRLRTNRNAEFKFFNMSTDAFFNKPGGAYDCVFIDADHTYESVKKDFENSKKRLNGGGIIVFHDIVCDSCGDNSVRKLWNEIQGKKIEFIHGIHCGIGIIEC